MDRIERTEIGRVEPVQVAVAVERVAIETDGAKTGNNTS